jgi:predicted MFS family arabinose efflux permease
MVGRVLGIYRRAYDGLPKEIWLLSGALFINRFGTMVLPFLTLYLTSEMGYQEATAGRMLSVYGLGSICGAYLGGRLVKSVGAVRLQILLLFLSVPAFLAVPLFHSSWGIAASLFLLSFFTDGVRPANATAVTQYAPVQLRVRAFGLQRMAVNLGISFGPAIGGVLATINFVWLFVADASTTLLCAFALLTFFGFKGDADAESSHAATHGPSSTASPAKDPLYLVFLGLILLTSVVFFQIHATYPLYLTEHYGMTKPMIGLIYAVNTVVIVVVEMVLLNYFRRWSMISIIGWGAFFSCLGFGMLPFGRSVAHCVFSMLVITLGEMLWMPLASGWIAHRSDRGNRGLYMGWYAMQFSIAAIIAPALGGAVYQYDRDLMWYISTGLAVLVLAGFYWLNSLLTKESQRDSSLETQPTGQ